jgi:O-antigen/teichoic acid export membrane protein
LLKHKPLTPRFALNSTRANMVWAAASQTIEKLAGYFVIAVFTRALLKSDLGALFFALSISEICATMLNFGTDSLLIRRVSTEPGQAVPHFSRILSLRLVNMLAGYAVINLFVYFFRPDLLPVFCLVAAYDFLEEIHFVFLAFFTGQKRQLYRLVMFGGFKILSFVALSLTALWTGSLFFVLWTQVFLNLLLVLMAFAYVRRQFGPFQLRFDPRSGMEIMRLSMPFFFINFLTILHMRFDTVMVGLLLGLQQVAVYELGIKMMEVTRFVVRPLHSVLFPVFSEYVARGEWARLRARFVLLTGAVLGIGIVLAAGMQAFGPRLIVLLFGSGYQESAPPAQILFVSVPMMYVGLMCVTLAAAMHREAESALILGASVALNLALNFVLIPRTGIIGAAWATVISQTVLMTGMLMLTAVPLFQAHRTAATAGNQIKPPDPF